MQVAYGAALVLFIPSPKFHKTAETLACIGHARRFFIYELPCGNTPNQVSAIDRITRRQDGVVVPRNRRATIDYITSNKSTTPVLV